MNVLNALALMVSIFFIPSSNQLNANVFSGEEKCSSKACEAKEASKIGECQTLFNCSKKCLNGFRINKKGCEICKCNPSKVNPELLTKYNITYVDLVNLLEDYKSNKTSTTTTSTTTTPTPTTKSAPQLPTVLIIRRNGNDEKTASPETVITPAYLPEEGKFQVKIA